jgi:hypothetical protein
MMRPDEKVVAPGGFVGVGEAALIGGPKGYDCRAANSISGI